MYPTLDLGPLALQTRPVVLLLSVMLALEVCQRMARRSGLDGDSVYNIGFVSAIAALVGARAGFVIDNWDSFAGHMLDALALTADGLSVTYGLVAGLLVAYIYAQRKGLDNVRLLDALAPGLVVLAAGAALANLASGDGYGSMTSAPWAIEHYGALRHPVQMYHLIAALAIGVIVLAAGKPFDGARFWLFVALYAASRLVVEAFHGDSALVGGLRVVQVVSLGALVASLLALRWLARRSLAPAPLHAGEQPHLHHVGAEQGDAVVDGVQHDTGVDGAGGAVEQGEHHAEEG